MPFRPGLDDDDALQSLIKAWGDGAADLQSRLDGVFARIRAELAGEVNANTVFRLREQAKRLTELQGVALSIVDDLAQGTRSWIDGGGPTRVYVAGPLGAGLPFSFTEPHRAAVEVLSKDLYDDVLVATRFVEADAKRWIREVGRELTGFKLTGGVPVKTQARRLERDLREHFVKEGMGAVTYRDGSRHSFGEYGEMLLRTKSGIMYNRGTLNTSRLLGIEVFEILDGAECGLTSHYDPELANGRLVSLEFAIAYPLSHPNCRRAIVPRPDVKTPDDPGFRSVQSDESRADQAAFEKALRAQQKARESRSATRRPQRATSRPQRPVRATRATRATRPTGSAQKAATGVQGAQVPAGFGHIDVDSGVRHDFAKLVGGRTQEFLDVASGPVDAHSLGKSGPGVVFVDDRGRLFFWEKGTQTREEVIGKMKALMKENRRSLPVGVDGARAHVVVQGESLTDAAMSKRYGRPFKSAANANLNRVAYFHGNAATSTVWHENGHVAMRAINDRIGDKLRDERFSFTALENLSQAEAMERMAEVGRISAHGDTGAQPGTRWLSAMLDDKARLNALDGEGNPAYVRLYEDFVGSSPRDGGVAWPMSIDGTGLGADGKLREGVTDYGATNAAEDFAESWRLMMQDRTGVGVGSYRKPDGFLTTATWGEVYEYRARAVRDMLDVAGLELEEF